MCPDQLWECIDTQDSNSKVQQSARTKRADAPHPIVPDRRGSVAQPTHYMDLWGPQTIVGLLAVHNKCTYDTRADARVGSVNLVHQPSAVLWNAMAIL